MLFIPVDNSLPNYIYTWKGRRVESTSGTVIARFKRRYFKNDRRIGVYSAFKVEMYMVHGLEDRRYPRIDMEDGMPMPEYLVAR